MKFKELEKFALYLRLDRGLGPKTVLAYVSDVAQFLDGRSYRAANLLTVPGVRNHIAQLSRHGLSARSLARKLSALRLFFKFALEEGLCKTDPTVGIESPRPARALPKSVSHHEIDQLLSSPSRQTDALMLRVMYAAGLRVSELVSLKLDALDLQSGSVRVQGKGEKTRIVPLDASTTEQLIGYLQTRPSGCGDTVFLSARKKPFTRQGFWKLLKKYAQAAGIDRDISPHTLRHAFATHLLEQGMNLRSLQTLLGHSDISTTQIYSHVATAHLREALVKNHPKGKK